MNFNCPDHRHARVLIIFRNPAHLTPASHIGLGVCATHTARVLREAGIEAHVAGAWEFHDVRRLVDQIEPTHCMIEAPWISNANLAAMASENPLTHFNVRCHSQIGFLQVEPGAVQIFREGLALSESLLNVSMSGNSRRFASFIENAYNTRCHYIPNLYAMDRPSPKSYHPWSDGVLKVGSFGAIRLQKNHSTAAAAAMIAARRKGVELEFHMTVNREEGGAGVLDSLRRMFTGLSWARLVENPWMSWSQFRQHIGTMDLTFQLSATETFNIVTADSVAEGVPAVTSAAIEWSPKHWQAEIDDADDVARIACNLLNDDRAPDDGRRALEQYINAGLGIWKGFLDFKAREAA